MPIYTYTCTACNDMIEKRQSFSDPPLTTCEQCGGTLRKVIHPVGIVFKGSGWYITDYARKDSSSGKDGKGETGETAEKGKADGGTEAKSEVKPQSSKSESSKSESSKAESSKSGNARKPDTASA